MVKNLLAMRTPGLDPCKGLDTTEQLTYNKITAILTRVTDWPGTRSREAFAITERDVMIWRGE